LHTFPVPLFLKLDDDNYLIWKQQILAHVSGLQPFHFLDRSAPPPPRFLTTDDATAKKVNPAFLVYQQQDHLLVPWLLGSMTTPILTKMVGLCSASEIWGKLQVYYAS